MKARTQQFTQCPCCNQLVSGLHVTPPFDEITRLRAELAEAQADAEQKRKDGDMYARACTKAVEQLAERDSMRVPSEIMLRIANSVESSYWADNPQLMESVDDLLTWYYEDKTMTNVCEHGSLNRVCLICEQTTEIASLRAELAALKAENERLRDSLRAEADFWKARAKEREFSNRQLSAKFAARGDSLAALAAAKEEKP